MLSEIPCTGRHPSTLQLAVGFDPVRRHCSIKPDPPGHKAEQRKKLFAAFFFPNTVGIEKLSYE
jgi:hypothetical protein